MMTKWQASQSKNIKILLGLILGAVSHTVVEKVLFRLIAPSQHIALAWVTVHPSVSLHPSPPPPVPPSGLSMRMRATCPNPGKEPPCNVCAHSYCKDAANMLQRQLSSTASAHFQTFCPHQFGGRSQQGCQESKTH